MRRRTFIIAAAATAAVPILANAQPVEGQMAAQPPTTGYVEVNGLSMYYESHGSGGVPLVLLHGAFSSIHNSFGRIIPGLAANRQVVGFDYQGHGRTADIDRPMSHDAIVGDVVAALDELGIRQADILGYSTGGYIALRLAVSHPERVRKLVVMSTGYRLDGVRPGLMEGIGEMQPSMMYGSPWHEEYLALNPAPEFDRLFRKKTEMDKGTRDFTDAEIKALTQPVLIIAGDSDLHTIEHLVQFFRLAGGDVFGDTPNGLPRSQLAILPGASHVTAPFQTELLLSIVPAFLDRQT